MRYIEQFREGMRVSDVYLCKTKQHAVTKNGKEYASVLLQDKTVLLQFKLFFLFLLLPQKGIIGHFISRG